MLSAAKHLTLTIAAVRTTRARCFAALCMTVFALVISSTALAQSAPADTVYTYVEQMPQLPGGGGQMGIQMEIARRIHYPVFDLRKDIRTSGLRYSFTVRRDGTVTDVKTEVASRNPVVDEAILQAIRSLPVLQPGMQYGRRVPVRLTYAISCLKI